MPLRPRKRLPTALEMEFPSEMAFQPRWKWNCVHAMGFQPRWKWNFRQKRASNRVGNGISVGNGLPIALEVKLRPRNTISNVFQAIISPSEYTTAHEKPQIPKNLGPSIH